MRKLFFSWLILVALPCCYCSAENRSNNAEVPVTAVELIGVASIRGDMIDKSGLDHRLDPDTTNNMVGGFSAIAYSGQDNLYYFLSDRGPKDGAVDWTCRVQTFKVKCNTTVDSKIDVQLVATTLFRNRQGNTFTGRAAAFAPSQYRGVRFDPEGIRVKKNGNLVVSDEYGPRLIEFSPSGNEVRRFEIPSRYLISNPGLNKADENPRNASGRRCNKGMEGLALSPDGQTMFGLMQSPLLQDSIQVTVTKSMSDGTQFEPPSTKLVGQNCRMLRMNADGTEIGEWLYRLDQPSNKLNEVLACSDSTFAVIERDGEAGTLAAFKKIMLVSSGNASNINQMQRLPHEEIPTGVRPLQKKVLIDLLDPKWGLAGEQMPEKIESLAFGPDLPDGRKMLLIGSDNDFVASSESKIYVFAISKQVLTDWQNP